MHCEVTIISTMQPVVIGGLTLSQDDLENADLPTLTYNKLILLWLCERQFKIFLLVNLGWRVYCG